MARTEYISLEEAAQSLNLSRRTIRRWVSDGRVTAYRVGPKTIRLDRSQITALLVPIPAHDRGER